jgi:F-type H+-transporting ATPase subunit delta
MATSQQHSPIAISYAQALLDLAREQNVHEHVAQDLAGLKQVIDGDPRFGQFLRDPSIGDEERRGVIDRTIRPRVNPLVANFLGVLGQHGRLGALDQVAAAYQHLLDEMMGKVEVEVTVAQQLSADQLEQVRKRVSDALRKTAVIKQHVDDSIIGGMVLKVEDKLIDASVRTQLQTMKRQLLARRPR